MDFEDHAGGRPSGGAVDPHGNGCAIGRHLLEVRRRFADCRGGCLQPESPQLVDVTCAAAGLSAGIKGSRLIGQGPELRIDH